MQGKGRAQVPPAWDMQLLGYGNYGMFPCTPLFLLQLIAGLCLAAVLRGFVGSGKVKCKSIGFFFLSKLVQTYLNLCLYLHSLGTELFSFFLFPFFFPPSAQQSGWNPRSLGWGLSG